MSIASVSQTMAVQHEYLRPDLEKLYLASSRLWSRMKSRTDVKAISNRPARIPFEALSGGKFRADQSGFNGGDMGTGSGPTETFGNLSCTAFLQASEYTALTEYATDTDEKAIKNYVSLTQQRAAETFAGYMDSVMQGDGSNTLDTVVSTTTNGLVVNNANRFQDNQDVDCWSALSGTFLGTITILSVDSANNTIWLDSAVPAGVTTGTLLLVQGSSGAANSGLFGLRYYQVAGNAGNYMGVQRSAFPGKFSTPNISVNGTLTPAVVRAINMKVQLAIGIEKAQQANLVAHCNVDMQVAWESNAILVQSVIMNQVKGDEATDMLKKNAPTVMAGREVLANERATPGLIDFLGLKHWFRLETKALDYYEVGGQTVFPAYGASGGLESTMLFYLVMMVQLGNGQPRVGAYLNNITVPPNIFS